MKILKSIFLAAALLLSSLQVFASFFSNEKLNYVISYKWGLIHKDAGTATLQLSNQGDQYKITLTGKTKPWADSFFQVRDTLIGIVKKQGFQPQSYTKIAHEDGKYSRDDISYIYGGSTVTGIAKRHKVNKKGEVTNSEKELHASGQVLDMLSSFYFMRTIDYSKLDDGHEVEATVFSGSKSETLTIRCIGKEVIKLRDKTKRDAYHIKFRFTTKGKKKSSDDLDAWISTDAAHIPLLVEGSLPVGKVKCYYVN